MPVLNDPGESAQMLAAALSAPVPRFYVNGFVLAQSLSDVMLVGQTNGAASTIVNMSFTTAKSLSRELAKIVRNFEDTMGHSILTMEDIQERGQQQAQGQ